MKLALWHVVFGTRRWGDNWSSMAVIARTGEEAIRKAKLNAPALSGRDSYYVQELKLLGRSD